VQQGLISAKAGVSENDHQAKFYSLTPPGRKHLQAENSKLERLTQAIACIMLPLEEEGRSCIFRRRQDNELDREILDYVEREPSTYIALQSRLTFVHNHAKATMPGRLSRDSGPAALLTSSWNSGAQPGQRSGQQP
jgi:hypothetical protein